MESNDLFTLSEDNKNGLDFRWIGSEDNILLTEDTVYMGVMKKEKSPRATEAFVQWFFTVETQRQLLETSKANRMIESVFGICGGFSAIAPVTEQIFPRFYPDLLGRMPPAESLTPAPNLPANWVTIKERVILPYLHDRARTLNANNEVNPLEKRLEEWIRMNR
jgi:hypothetical protein